MGPGIVGIVALVMVFGMPVFIVGITKYFNYKRDKLKLLASHNPADVRRIETLETERKQLEERVQNLETIVCSVDLELNARLNRLAAQSPMYALPAPEQRAALPGPVGASAAATSGALPSTIPGALELGAVLMNRFRIEERLGRGGMGEVYRATDLQVGEVVALKTVAGPLMDDPAATERLRREVAAARKISHPNVIRVHDLYIDGRLAFLTMEYFPATTLGELLRRRHLLPLAEVRALLQQMCPALEAAHAAGVVHRDLKPANVLINDQRTVRLIDFGLAQATYLHGMTATGIIMGTPEYMAPEQLQGQAIDARADIYALGALTYHMLCGRPPFVAETPIAVAFLHCKQEPRPPRELVPGIPPALEAAILRCLAKQREQRLSRVSELLAS